MREYFEIIDVFRKRAFAAAVEDGVIVRVQPPATGMYLMGRRMDEVCAEAGGRRFTVKKAVVVPSFIKSS